MPAVGSRTLSTTHTRPRWQEDGAANQGAQEELTRGRRGDTTRQTHRLLCFLQRTSERCGLGLRTTSSPAGHSLSPSTPSGLSHLQLPSMAALPSSLPMLLLSRSFRTSPVT